MRKNYNYYKKEYLHRLIEEKNKKKAYLSIPLEHRTYTILDLPEKIKIDVLKNLSGEDIFQIFKKLDPDDIADLNPFINKRKREIALSKLNKNQRNSIEKLQKHNPESAGGVTSTDFILIDDHYSFHKIREKIKKHLEKEKNFPTILIKKDSNIIGALPIEEIFIGKGKIKNLNKVTIIKCTADREELLKAYNPHDHETIVIEDDENSILGVIKNQDIFKVSQAEATEDYHKLSSVNKDENIHDGVLKKFQSRFKWIIVFVGITLISAFIIAGYEEVIARHALLAAFMPLIAGIAGSAGTQTLGIIIRAITLDQVKLSKSLKIILKEIISALMIGSISGSIVGTIAIFMGGSSLMGIVIGLAIMLNIVLSGIFGTIIPLSLKSLKIDPAVASSSFLTALADVLGFIIYLALAQSLLM